MGAKCRHPSPPTPIFDGNGRRRARRKNGRKTEASGGGNTRAKEGETAARKKRSRGARTARRAKKSPASKRTEAAPANSGAEKNDRRRARKCGRRRHGQSARASGRTCSAETNRPQRRADLFGKDQRRARTGSGDSVPYVSAVTRSMTCGVSGRSRMSVGTDAISSTTSIPSMTLPKAAYWPSR